MKLPFRIYRLGLGLYYMRPLTFGENLRVTDIMRKKLGTRQVGDVSVADILDVMYEGGGISQLFTIVLKPLFRSQAPVHEVLLGLQREKVSRILSDFFVLNPDWLVRLTTLALLTNMTPERRDLLMKMIRIHLTQSSDSPAGTSLTLN